METKTALWLCIDTAFAEVVEMCLAARAAELVLQKQKTSDPIGRALGFGGASPAAEKPLEAGRYARAAELAKDLGFREAHPNGADLVALRSNLRKRLVWLRGKLAEVLAEHEVYYVLFPFVVYCDELVSTAATRGAASRWESMQSELYEIDNGGELFYQILEERLKQSETHPLVFEIFYFCLLDGFTGTHQPGSNKIQEYKALLLARIPRPEIPCIDARREQKRPDLIALPWQYYAVASAIVLIAYGLLSWTAGS